MEQDIQKLWTVIATGKARKQVKKLPVDIQDALYFLVQELHALGPERDKWFHYGKLAGKEDFYHCHLNKGKPRYVAVWKVTDQIAQLMEIRYVGTHENADYRRIN